MQPAFELADVLNLHWPQIEKSAHINSFQLRVLSALKVCRTAALGGHLDACNSCGTVRISYNSCRNRHCPKCQGHKREVWIQNREADLLPVPYFHVVFTLPSALNKWAMQQPKKVYDALFEAAWQTLNLFGLQAQHLGAQTGMIAILHTWGQQLTLHPHLHCIVPGGGITKTGVWKLAKSNGKYLFPVKAMSVVFRGKYIATLAQKGIVFTKDEKAVLYKNNWVVFAKQPFGNAASVVEYLGRYTHKIAISNHRILQVDKHTVTFSYKDYRMAGNKKQLTLTGLEFIRRFALHILPHGYVRIRHYGLLSSTSKRSNLAQIRAQVKAVTIRTKDPRIIIMYNPLVCPCCKTETMVTIHIYPKRGPPNLAIVKTIKMNTKQAQKN